MAIEEITARLARLKTLMANIYFLGTPGGPWVLVDTGTPGNAGRIRRAAEERFGKEARPHAIVLTHGHGDHAGSARESADAWDVPIYAHRLERPYLTGKAKYPPKDPTVGGAMGLLSRFIPRSVIDLGDRLNDLPEGGEVPGLVGWRWHFTPGHAPGHVALFHRYDSLLLAGDACTTMDLDSAMGIVSEEPKISRPPAPFTYDWEQAHASVELLADLRPAVIGAGHGEPMSGSEVTAGLEELARNFPRPQGRYAVEPARVDETGVRSLPPEVDDPLPRVMGVVGLAAVALGAVLVLSRRGRG